QQRLGGLADRPRQGRQDRAHFVRPAIRPAILTSISGGPEVRPSRLHRRQRRCSAPPCMLHRVALLTVAWTVGAIRSNRSNVMALDPRGAALALHRFGFGPKLGSTSGSIAAIASDPRGAVLAELEAPKAGQIVNPNLPSSGAEARTVFDFFYGRQAGMALERRRREAAQAAAAENPGSTNAMAMEDKPAEAAQPAQPNQVLPPRKVFLDEAGARIRAAANVDIGFV